MKWFGTAYGARYEIDTPHVPTPIGELCEWCRECISFHDDGIILPLLGNPDRTHAAYHYECHLRLIVGGVNHQLHLCHCTGCAGVLAPDPPNLTRREAARAAVRIHESMRGRP
jgi:hypothetical protein